MQKRNYLRKRLYVDPKVQGGLVLRVAFYWFVCLVTITLLVLCWRILTGPVRPFHAHVSEIGERFGPTFIASLILLPLVIVDIMRFSNRFVGPLVRLRRALRALGRGEQVSPLRFRDGDFWHEFAGEFNAVAKRIEDLSTAEAPETDPSNQPSGSEEHDLVGASC
jgi:hypothetical protein